MKLYCIHFVRTYPDKNTSEHEFFVQARNVFEAKKIYIYTTGYSLSTITNINIIEERI